MLRLAKLVVTALRKIETGEEVTVDYGPSLWFMCEYGSTNCSGRSRDRKTRASQQGGDEDEDEDNDDDGDDDDGDFNET